MGQQLASGVIGATFYSTLLTGAMSFVEKGQPQGDPVQLFTNIATFWIAFMMPTGLAWQRVNSGVAALVLGKQNYVKDKFVSFSTLAFANKRALFADIVLNHALYQTFAVGGLYYFLEHVAAKCFRDKRREELVQQQQDKGGEDDFYETQDAYQLFKTRIKLSVVSVLWDLWFPQVAMRNVVTQVIKLSPQAAKLQRGKDLIVSLIWHCSIIEAYLHPKLA